jgi:hypothetical protein
MSDDVDFLWEDNLLERKVESDLKDLARTLVGFANSVKPGHVATVLIGEKDDGTAVGVKNADNIQQTVRERCEKIYPNIIWRSRVYERDGKHCVRVEIEYSGDTPHFEGPAWIRRGSSTVRASDEIFQRLIETRNSMVREISQWLGNDVTVCGDQLTVPPPREGVVQGLGTYYEHRWPRWDAAKVVFVNSFWVTLEKNTGERLSEPFEKLTLNFDNQHERLMLTVRY